MFSTKTSEDSRPLHNFYGERIDASTRVTEVYVVDRASDLGRECALLKTKEECSAFVCERGTLVSRIAVTVTVEERKEGEMVLGTRSFVLAGDGASGSS